MRRLWALAVVAVVVVAGFLTYWVVAHSSGSSPCNSTSGSSPLAESLGAPPLILEFNNSSKVGSEYWSNFTILTSSVVIVGELTLWVRQSNGTPEEGVKGYMVWNRSAVIVATATGATSTWVDGADSLLQNGDIVTVVSVASLSSEDLVATVPGSCGATWTMVVIIGT